MEKLKFGRVSLITMTVFLWGLNLSGYCYLAFGLVGYWEKKESIECDGKQPRSLWRILVAFGATYPAFSVS